MGRIADLSELINANNKICLNNNKIVFVMLLNIIFSFGIYLLGVWAYITYFQSSLSLIGLSILVLLISMYFRAFFAGVQSWLVASIVWEEKPKLGQAFLKSFKNFWGLAVFSIIILIVGLMGQSLNREKKHFLSKHFQKTFEGIPIYMWETTSHLALPEMMEKTKGFTDAMNEVKKAVNYFKQITFKSLGLDYYCYTLVSIALIISIMFSIIYFVSLGVMIYVAFLLALFIKQSYIKTTYYTVLYAWLAEQIKRKKKKQKIETRVPEILENTIIV